MTGLLRLSENPDFTLQKRAGRALRRSLYTFHGPMQRNVIFMHIPKCGGNSLISAIRSVCPFYSRTSWVTFDESCLAAAAMDAQVEDIQAYHDDNGRGDKTYEVRRAILNYAVQHGHSFVGGHFLFDPNIAALKPDTYKWITIVRDPVPRLISHYGEEVRSGLIPADVDTYLESDLARRHGTVLIRYFSGRPDAGMVPGREDEDLACACANARKFAVIGFIDKMETFEEDFARSFGRKITVAHARKGMVKKPDLTEAQMQKIRDLSRYDIALFERLKQERG